MITVLESLNAALHRAMQMDDRVMLIGEDILDPYGGAFKITRGILICISRSSFDFTHI